MAFLLTDIKDFLEMCTKELDETFSSTCTFPSMSSVLMDHVYEMKVKVEKDEEVWSAPISRKSSNTSGKRLQ